jgi:hypothetical protein
MNKTKILAVADAIESHSIPDLGFNMATYCTQNDRPDHDRSGHNCGTTACIGGWAIATEKSKDALLEMTYGPAIFDLARKILELDTELGKKLMIYYTGSPTSVQAANCLRHLAETGEVDWDRFAPNDED